MTPRERLAFLARKLREPLPDDLSFNLATWLKDRHCGTAACAVGFAMTLPELQAEGLSKRKFGDLLFLPEFEGETSWSAVRLFFGLSKKDANHLFNPNRYPGEQWGSQTAVADRIESWLRKHPETAPA